MCLPPCPSHPPSHHRASCAIQGLPPSHLVHARQCTHVSVTPSPFPPPLPLPCPPVSSLHLCLQSCLSVDSRYMCGVCAKSLQSCPTLHNPIDCSPPGSSVHGILQARILEWDAISSSRGASQPRDQTHISYISGIGRQVLHHSCHQGVNRQYLFFSFSLKMRKYDLLSGRLLCIYKN